MSSVAHIAQIAQHVHRVAKATLAKATSVRGQVENISMPLISQTELGVLLAIGEVPQWLEHERIVTALGSVITST